MELIQGKHMKASKFEPEDFISNMPDDVVTDIMDRLPLQDAVRTSILSRNWRFKWTMLTQLVFDKNFFDCFLDTNGETDDSGRVISRLLLDIRGVITKFVLSIDKKACYSAIVDGISHWILCLSRKGIKDLTLESCHGTSLKLPDHLFSCLELKRLKLVHCRFDPPASFHGFPNLISLELDHVRLESGKFVKFLTRCLILENLNMSYRYGDGVFLLPSAEYLPEFKVKLAEISKLANLRKLSMFLCMVDNPGSSSILEPVGLLSKLQKLHLNFKYHKFTEGVAEERFHTTFPCLKTLQLSEIDLSNGIQLSYALQLISGSPNLHSLEIKSTLCGAFPTPGPEVDYDTMGLLQLQSVVLMYLRDSDNEVCLIKYLLVCSPSLKKVVIRPYPCLKSEFKVKLAEISKHANLRKLSLFLCMVDNPGSSSILELVGLLSKLQKLHLNFNYHKFTEGVAEERFPTTFPCLKTLQLSEIDLSNGIQLSYALQLISSSPNLHTLEIKSTLCYASPTPGPEVTYNTMGLLQLQSVVLEYLRDSDNEVCLIKYLLACSPSLEKIVIRPYPCLKSDEMSMFTRKLLKLHRASRAVDIINLY